MMGLWKNFAFAQPLWLWLLLVPPLLALWRSRRGAAASIVYSSTAPFTGLGLHRRTRAGGFWFGAFLLGLSLLTVALARPEVVNATTHVHASGIDIMMALDVSRSMLAQDIQIGSEEANRIEAAKKVSGDFIDKRPNDRIGMIAFAGRPYLVSPLTLDHDWLARNLERVKIGLVEDGTAIGVALASCGNRLKDRKEAKSKIVVLATDGANNAGQIDPVTAAEALHTLGIKIYTIGIGVEGRAPVPVPGPFGGTVMQYIDSDVDVPLLKKLAEIGQGKFYRATDGDSLQHIFSEIDQLEKTTVELTESRQHQDLYPWFLMSGAACVLLHAVFGSAWQRRLP